MTKQTKTKTKDTAIMIEFIKIDWYIGQEKLG